MDERPQWAISLFNQSACLAKEKGTSVEEELEAALDVLEKLIDHELEKRRLGQKEEGVLVKQLKRRRIIMGEVKVRRIIMKN